jgi:hypothetical protein
MSDTIAAVPAMGARSGFDHVSDVMVYDIARHTASVLCSVLLVLKDTAGSDTVREHWAARRRLVKQQVKTLDVADRAGMIAQNEGWMLEKLALTGPWMPPRPREPGPHRSSCGIA